MVSVLSHPGGNHTLSLTLLPDRRYALVSAVVTCECGHKDAITEAQRLADSAAMRPQRESMRTQARAWWARFWESTPAIQHFSVSAMQFYYGSLFAMASGKRAGTVGIDRQGPFMTQDNSIWPYICNNYNLQAPYYGMHAANQAWMFGPLFDRVMASLPLFQRRAAHLLVNIQSPELGQDVPPPESFGQYAGIEMPVRFLFSDLSITGTELSRVRRRRLSVQGHIGAYDWMWDGSYEGQDAGQRFDAPFTSMLMIDYYDFTQNRTFLEHTGYPFVRLVCDFIESYVRNDTTPGGGLSQ